MLSDLSQLGFKVLKGMESRFEELQLFLLVSQSILKYGQNVPY